MEWIRRNLKIVLPAGLVGAAVLAWLAFGVFGIHTAFFDDEVDEAVPVFESGAGASGLPSDEQSDELIDDMNEFMADNETPLELEAAEAMPAMAVAEPEIVTLVEGSFVDRSHPGEGIAKVLNDGSEQRFLRFEEFETDNGPDLFVYLTSAPADAPSGDFGVDGEFVNLGRLTGNIGPQNYEIPVDVDLDRFSTVVVWCRRFSVAFTAADLA